MDQEHEICPLDQSRLRSIAGICKAAQLLNRTQEIKKRRKRIGKPKASKELKRLTILAELKRDSR